MSKRAEEFELKRDGQKDWNGPTPNKMAREAEWGYETDMTNDIIQFADKAGYKVKRMVFTEPEHLSPLVADMYRIKYEEKGLPTNRIIADSFVVMEPYWTLR